MVYYYNHQCRKWMVLVAAIWIQAFAGTNFDFPSYSTEMKSSLNIDQVQLLYLAMASDIGKLFGWCSGILMLWFPTWVVLFMAAFLGLVGYGAQWLIVCRQLSVPYFVMFILSLLAGGSIPWFNTVCFVVNINNFPENWPLAVSLSVSFNGVTAALYNLLTTKIFPNDKSTSYLLLNAVVPFIVAIAALGPILQQPGSENHQTDETVIKDDAQIFVCLYILAAVTGLYLFFLDLKSQNIYIMSMFLIILPFISPSIIYLIKKMQRAYYFKQQPVNSPSYNLVEFEHHEEFPEECITPVVNTSSRGGCGFNEIIEQDQLTVLGEEHSATNLVSRCDFWLYYIAYFCGGTIGLVYSNNLGQVVQSLGYISMTKPLVTTYSTCSFFGRLLSGAADLVACFYHQTYTGMYSTRTGRLSLALVPMPFAFFLLILSDGLTVLRVTTGLIGICSGFLVSTAVTITSELFGSESSRINHNILITNIPLGSLIYSVTASLVYDDHIRSSEDEEGSTVCIGRKCYYQTFILWGCVSLLGLVSSFLLSLRTKPAYERYYKERRSKQPSISDEF